MSDSVPSNGKIQEAFEKFVRRIDSAPKEYLCKGLDWFAGRKDDGHMRLDCVCSALLFEAASKFCLRFGRVPAVIKEACRIVLEQGRKDWRIEFADAKCGISHDVTFFAKLNSDPWDKN